MFHDLMAIMLYYLTHQMEQWRQNNPVHDEKKKLFYLGLVGIGVLFSSEFFGGPFEILSVQSYYEIVE